MLPVSQFVQRDRVVLRVTLTSHPVFRLQQDVPRSEVAMDEARLLQVDHADGYLKRPQVEVFLHADGLWVVE